VNPAVIDVEATHKLVEVFADAALIPTEKGPRNVISDLQHPRSPRICEKGHIGEIVNAAESAASL
jgi:hypothetical protein